LGVDINRARKKRRLWQKKRKSSRKVEMLERKTGGSRFSKSLTWERTHKVGHLPRGNNFGEKEEED